MTICRVQLIMAHFFIPTYVGEVSDVLRCFPSAVHKRDWGAKVGVHTGSAWGRKKNSIFHLNKGMRGCCHLSQWFLLNSYSTDEKANADISSAINGMLQVICSYVCSWTKEKNKDVSLSLSVAFMLSRTYISKHLLIDSLCIWHIIRLLKKSLCSFLDEAHV